MNQEELTNYEREQLIKKIRENNERINELLKQINTLKSTYEEISFNKLKNNILEATRLLDSHRIHYQYLTNENSQLLNWLNILVSNWFIKLVFPKLTKEIITFINTETAKSFANSSIKNFYTGEIEPPITPCDFDANSTYENDIHFN